MILAVRAVRALHPLRLYQRLRWRAGPRRGSLLAGIGLVPGVFAILFGPAQFGGGGAGCVLRGVDAGDGIAFLEATVGVLPLRAVEDDEDARGWRGRGAAGLLFFVLVVVEWLGEESFHVGADAGGVAAAALEFAD